MGNSGREAVRSMALRCHGWGANVTAIRSTGSSPYKNPAHRWKHFQTRRQTEEEAEGLGWGRKDLSGCGVISGPGAFRSIDIDDCEAFGPVEEILGALELPHSYRWVVRSGSFEGWHIWLRCWGNLPEGVLKAKEKNAGVREGAPKASGTFGHLELRWTGCQTLLPPSKHESGRRYQFLNGVPQEPPLEVPAKRVVEAVRAVCAGPEAGKKPRMPSGAETRYPERSARGHAADDISRVKERLRAASSQRLIAYAKECFGYEAETEPSGDIRILGNGGLLIRPSPESGTVSKERKAATPSTSSVTPSTERGGTGTIRSSSEVRSKRRPRWLA